jgi:hypothetical protein
MPKNCSRDVSRVVDYIDKVNKSGSKKKVQQLKELFGLGDIEHFDDFARYLHNFQRQLSYKLTCVSLKRLGEWTLAMAVQYLLHRLLRIL